MYYDEKVIDGVLCYRYTPKGQWIEFTPEKLTKEIIELRERVTDLVDNLARVNCEIISLENQNENLKAEF